MVTPRRGDHTFQANNGPRPSTYVGLASSCIEHGQILTLARLWSKRRPALIVSELHGDGIAHEGGGRVKAPPAMEGSLDTVGWLPVLSTNLTPVGMIETAGGPVQ